MNRARISAVAGAIAIAAAVGVDAAAPAGYVLTFSDEFNGSSLDQSKWSFGFGWGTNSGSFSEQNRTQNLTFSNGEAVIKAESVNGTYYSAAFNSRNKMTQKYGYWEARVKISANVPGLDPAFWQKLNNDKWPPETDIFEFFGTNKKQAMTIHWSTNGHSQSGTFYDGGDMTGAYHTYGLEYTSSYMRWWTDGKVVREITPSTHKTFFDEWDDDKVYVMFNVHMTDKYNWLGSVDKSKLPVYMTIDYFRMYAKGATSLNTPSPVTKGSKLTIYREAQKFTLNGRYSTPAKTARQLLLKVDDQIMRGIER